jgi:hypothetical protein
MHNLRISRNTIVTPASTSHSQTLTPQNIGAGPAAAIAVTSPNASIAKSVKLRPRQSIKRTHDLPATVGSLRANARNQNYTESTMDESIISLSSINQSTTAKNLRRRKLNVHEHDHDASSENLDSSDSNVSCMSDTSTITTSSLASNRPRRK